MFDCVWSRFGGRGGELPVNRGAEGQRGRRAEGLLLAGLLCGAVFFFSFLSFPFLSFSDGSLQAVLGFAGDRLSLIGTPAKKAMCEFSREGRGRGRLQLVVL